MSDKRNITVSFPFLTVLFFIFLVLKLTGYIAWSWWWVTAPLWIPVALVGVVLGIGLFLVLIAALFKIPLK